MTWDRFFADVLPVLGKVGMVLLPVASALLTLAINQRHASSMAREDREANARIASDARSFDARQQRYSDRRSAIADFLAAAQQEEDKIDDFYRDHSTAGMDPIDVADDYRFQRLNEAHSHLVIIADPDVVEAAGDVVDSVKGAFHGRKGAWDSLKNAKERVLSEGRKMLVADAERRS